MKAATRSQISLLHNKQISIHAAREGGDVVLCLSVTDIAIFQSTPPVKAATCRLSISDYADTISIHAAREGGDQSRQSENTARLEFQSTPPVKAATAQTVHAAPYGCISIHAAREGGDSRF